MPNKVLIDVFKFEELEGKARERALQTGREWAMSDRWWWYATYEDFITVADLLGFSMAVDTRGEEDIQFSGFGSQGDGASFTGQFSLARAAGAKERIQSYAPLDQTLGRLADEAEQLAKEFKLWQEQVAPNVEADSCLIDIRRDQGMYVHAFMMESSSEPLVDAIAESLEDAAGEFPYYADVSRFEDRALDLARYLARWLYDQLEKESEYLTSDERVAEGFSASEVVFLSNGSVFHLNP